MSEQRRMNVLIIEDEAILAMELEFVVEDAGHTIAGWATSLQEAYDLAQDTIADLALVDIHLTDGITGIEVAERLYSQHQVPVVFMTANPSLIPSDFVGAIGVISKPYTTGGMAAVLAYLQQGIVTPPPRGKRPSGLILAPDYEGRWAS